MRRVLLLLAVPFMAIASPARASQQDCRLDPRLKGEETFLLLDRTTVLDPSAKDRWRRGVANLLATPSLSGDLRVLEVRSTATELRALNSACLDRPSAPPSQGETGLSGRLQALRDWWAGPPQDSTRDRRRLLEDRRDRTALIRATQRLVNTDDPTPSQTEISQSIAALLQTGCSGARRCTVLVFSDFLDASAKAHLRDMNPSRAGVARATQLLREYSPSLRSTAVSICGWGFGRDDAHPGATLDDRRREALRAYWTGFFQTINRRSAGGTIQLFDFL